MTESEKSPDKQELEKLRAENASLKAEVEKLRKAIPHYQTGEVSDDYEEFIEAEGVLWKRTPDGSLERLAYCPTCRLVTLPVPADNPIHLVCARCHFEAPFGVDELNSVAQHVSSDPHN